MQLLKIICTSKCMMHIELTLLGLQYRVLKTRHSVKMFTNGLHITLSKQNNYYEAKPVL